MNLSKTSRSRGSYPGHRYRYRYRLETWHALPYINHHTLLGRQLSCTCARAHPVALDEGGTRGASNVIVIAHGGNGKLRSDLSNATISQIRSKTVQLICNFHRRNNSYISIQPLVQLGFTNFDVCHHFIFATLCSSDHGAPPPRDLGKLPTDFQNSNGMVYNGPLVKHFATADDLYHRRHGHQLDIGDTHA